MTWICTYIAKYLKTILVQSVVYGNANANAAKGSPVMDLTPTLHTDNCVLDTTKKVTCRGYDHVG